jgi:MFS family permease
MKGLLRDHDTRMLLGSQWVEQAADGLMQAAFANVLILEPDGAPERILAVSALTLVPYSIIAPFMGVFVDRWRRRRILVITSIVRALLLALCAVVVTSESSDITLYAFLLVLLGLGRLFLTTKGAALPVVLHESHLLRGNALSGGGGMIASLVGAVAGIGTVAVMDTGGSLAIGAALYVVAAVIAARIRDPLAHGLKRDEAVGDAFKRIAAELAEGAREVWGRAAVRIPLTGVFATRTLAMLAAISAILVIKREFPDAGDDFGRLSSSALALGAAGVGAFICAVAAPAIGRKLDEARMMLAGFTISALGIVALGGIRSIPAVLALTFIGGFGGFLAKVSTDSLVQTALPDDLRGRGFAIYDILYNLSTVVAALAILGAESASFRIFLGSTGLVGLVFSLVLRNSMKEANLLPPPGAHARD